MVAKGTESLYKHCSNTVTQKWRVCSFLHVVVSIVIVNNFYLARVIKVCAVCNYGFFICFSIRSLLLIFLILIQTGAPNVNFWKTSVWKKN